jgi:hypothetical protein
VGGEVVDEVDFLAGRHGYDLSRKRTNSLVWRLARPMAALGLQGGIKERVP